MNRCSRLDAARGAEQDKRMVQSMRHACRCAGGDGGGTGVLDGGRAARDASASYEH